MEFKKGDLVKNISEGSKLIPLLLEDGWICKDVAKYETVSDVQEEAPKKRGRKPKVESDDNGS